MSLIDGSKSIDGAQYSGMMGDPVGMSKSTPSDPQHELMQCIQFMIQDLGLKDTEAKQLVEYAIANVQQISSNPKDAITFLKGILSKVANQSAGKVSFDKLKQVIDQSLASLIKRATGQTSSSGKKMKPASGPKKAEQGGVLDMIVPADYICPEGTVAVFEDGGTMLQPGKKICKRCRKGGSVNAEDIQSMFSKDTLDAIFNNMNVQYGSEGMQVPEAEETFQRIPGGYKRKVTFNAPGYQSYSSYSTSSSSSNDIKEFLKKFKL